MVAAGCLAALVTVAVAVGARAPRVSSAPGAVAPAAVAPGAVAPGASSAPGSPALSFSIAHTRPALPGARASTFFSVYPACACGRHTVIAQFSRRTGRLVRTLGTIWLGPGSQISTAATDAQGGMWMSFSAGPALAAPGTAGGGPEPNTCSSSLVRFDLRTGVVRTVMRFPPSVTVGNVVPSPDGRRVALIEGGCATACFNQHIVVLDLRSGRQVAIGADATPCHALFSVAWSRDGARLVFPYGPSSLPRNTSFVPAGTCEMPRFSRLVVVPAARSSSSRSWRLWKADPRCSYESAAFDRDGVVASEGCTTGAPPGFGNSPNLGRAYLVQLDALGRTLARLPLRDAYEEGAVVRDPITGHVLVSEDEAANTPGNGGARNQWVWEFDGRALRVIRNYPAIDATVVIAEPW